MEVIFIKLEYLRFILEVYKTQNITLAAKQLYTSQPYLSKGIKKVEDIIGVKIFKRSRHGTFPTEVGKEVILEIQSILYSLENLEHEYTPLNDENLKGVLSIATIPTLSMSLLPRTISAFKKKYTNIEFNIEEDHSFNIIEKVKKNKIDIGFIAISNINLSEENLDFHFITDSKIKACVSYKSFLSDKDEISLDEIIKYPVLSSSSFVINHLEIHGNPKFLFESKEIEGAKRAISEDLAIGIYTDLSLQFDPYVITKQIIPIKVAEDMFNLSLYFITRKNVNRVITKEFQKEFFKQLSIYKDEE